jgi:hypothetical protein
MKHDVSTTQQRNNAHAHAHSERCSEPGGPKTVLRIWSRAQISSLIVFYALHIYGTSNPLSVVQKGATTRSVRSHAFPLSCHGIGMADIYFRSGGQLGRREGGLEFEGTGLVGKSGFQGSSWICECDLR